MTAVAADVTVVAIDGPAGAGKSTVGRAVADRLGLDYLDTGAMYRAVTFAALRRGTDPADEAEMGELARSVDLRIEPAEAGSGYEFVNEIVGGRIPSEYIPSCEKGVIQALECGPFAGYPVVDMRVRLTDGSYHDVDSSEIAFKLAGINAFKTAAAKASPVILEPIMKVEVVTPEENMGDVVGDLNRRRGLIAGMDENPSGKVINAEVPLAEMFGYATDLRSATQGRATYTMEFAKYSEAPNNVAQEIITKNQTN